MQSKPWNVPGLDTDRWIRHFLVNRSERPEPDWEAPLEVPLRARAALTQSMVEFQLGDGGGPACLIAFDAEAFRASSGALRRLVDLWFAEEAEHSRLLGKCVERLGGEPIASHWSFALFCLLRKWLGVRVELQILTLTELVSTSYYATLRRHCADPALRDAWRLILCDESGHVAFHNDRLAAMGCSRRGVRGKAWAAQFKLCGFAAAGVLWSSHGRCLRQLGAGAGEFFRNAAYQVDRFLDKLDAAAQVRQAAAVPAVAPQPLRKRALQRRSPAAGACGTGRGS